MAKKSQYYRAQQAHKRNLQKIADEKAKQKEKEFIQKYGKQILIGVAAAIVLIVAIWLGCKWFVGPGGSIPNWFGTLRNVEEDWVIANLNSTDSPRYYKLAEFDSPEGYTKVEDDGLYTDTLVQTQSYVANDENAVVQEMYVSGVRDVIASEQIERVLGYYTNKSEAKQATIAGHDVHYGYITFETTPITYDDQGNAQEVPEEEQTGNSALVMYVDGIKDSCVLMMLYSKETTLADVTTMEALEGEMEKFLSLLTVEK